MIPRDKLYHFAVGAIIALLVSFVLPLAGAFIITFLVGIGKEVYDDLHPETHTSDGLDMLATGLGGLAMCLLLIGLK